MCYFVHKVWHLLKLMFAYGKSKSHGSFYLVHTSFSAELCCTIGTPAVLVDYWITHTLPSKMYLNYTLSVCYICFENHSASFLLIFAVHYVLYYFFGVLSDTVFSVGLNMNSIGLNHKAI